MPGYSEKEYEDFLDRVVGDATQIGIAISQIMAGRKKRILGVLAGMTGTKRERYVMTALAISANCEIMRETYFKNIFGMAKRIMKRHHKLGNYAKRDIVRAKLIPFMRACQLVISMEEIAYGVVDAFFDQYEVLTTQGLRPPQRKEDEGSRGVGWLATDEDRLEAVRKAKHAAEDRAVQAGVIDGSDKGKITVANVFESAMEEVEIDGFIDILEEPSKPEAPEKTKPKKKASEEPKDTAPKKEPESDQKKEKSAEGNGSSPRVLLPMQEDKENGD